MSVASLFVKCLAAIRRAVVEAKRTGAAKIVLAPGRYLCHDADGVLVDGLADVTVGRGVR